MRLPGLVTRREYALRMRRVHAARPGSQAQPPLRAAALPRLHEQPWTLPWAVLAESHRVPRPRVGSGYPRGLKQTNGESAENCLDDDRTKGSNAEPFHPAAFLNKACPDGDGEGQDYRRASYRAMTPLVSDSAMQRGNAE